MKKNQKYNKKIKRCVNATFASIYNISHKFSQDVKSSKKKKIDSTFLFIFNRFIITFQF